MSFPATSHRQPPYPAPPPMPAEYAYGQRAWTAGSWVMAPNMVQNVNSKGWAGPGPDARAAAMLANQYAQRVNNSSFPRKPPPNPGSAEYWATQLKENPLGLSNMHIKAPPSADSLKLLKTPKRSMSTEPNEDSTRRSQNLVWVPALVDNNVEGARGRHHDITRSNSQPSSGVRSRSEERLRRQSPPTASASRDRDRDGAATHRNPPPPRPLARFSSEPPEEIPRRLSAYPSGSSGRRHSEDPTSMPLRSAPTSSPEKERYPYEYDAQQPHRRSSHDGRDVRYFPQQPKIRSQSNTPSRDHSIPRAHTMPDNSSAPSSASKGLSRSHTAPSYVSQEVVGNDAFTSRTPLKPTFPTHVIRTPGHYSTPPRTPDDPERGFRERTDGGRESSSASSSRRPIDSITRSASSPSPLAGRQQKPSSLSLTRNSSLPVPGTMLGDSDRLDQISEESSDLLSPLILTDPLPAAFPAERVSQSARSFERGGRYPIPEVGGGGGLSSSPSNVISYTPPRTPSRYEDHARPQVPHSAPAHSSSYPRKQDNSTPSRHHGHETHQSQHYHTYPPLTPISPNTIHSHQRRQEDPSPPSRSNSGSGSGVPHSHHGSVHQAYPYGGYETPTRGGAIYRDSPSVPHSTYPSRGYGEGLSRQSSQTMLSSSPPSMEPYSHHKHHQPSHRPHSRSRLGTASPERERERERHYAPPRGSRSPSPNPMAPTRSSPHSFRPASPQSYRTSSPQPYRPSSTPSRSSHAPQSSHPYRHVRKGLWNRRGDHLTKEGFIVKAPADKAYPKDLIDYPDLGFMDHRGRPIVQNPGHVVEVHPDTVGHPPKKVYDEFIQFVLI